MVLHAHYNLHVIHTHNHNAVMLQVQMVNVFIKMINVYQ